MMSVSFGCVLSIMGLCNLAGVTEDAGMNSPGAVHLSATFTLSCLSAHDGIGNAEEVYGEVFIRLNGTHYSLWEISAKDAISIAMDSTVEIGPIAVNTNMLFQNGEDIVQFKELVFGAQLRERDAFLFSDDVLGYNQADYSDDRNQLKFIPTTMLFKNNGTVIQLEVLELSFGFGHFNL